MSIKVKKVKIAKGRTLEVTMTEYLLVNEIPTQNEVVKKCEYLAHQDLLDAFEKLHSHMVNICELDCDKALVKVTGFTLSTGPEGGSAIILVGSKTLTTGKVLNLVSPLTEFDSAEYEMGHILEDLITDCVTEVQLYINEGKSAVKQTAMNFDEDDAEADVQIGEGEAPKKRGRKKKTTMTISVNGGEEIPVDLDHAV